MRATTVKLPSGMVVQIRNLTYLDFLALSKQSKSTHIEITERTVLDLVLVNKKPITQEQLDDMPMKDVSFVMCVIADKVTTLADKITTIEA